MRVHVHKLPADIDSAPVAMTAEATHFFLDCKSLKRLAGYTIGILEPKTPSPSNADVQSCPQCVMASDPAEMLQEHLKREEGQTAYKQRRCGLTRARHCLPKGKPAAFSCLMTYSTLAAVTVPMVLPEFSPVIPCDLSIEFMSCDIICAS